MKEQKKDIYGEGWLERPCHRCHGKGYDVQVVGCRIYLFDCKFCKATGRVLYSINDLRKINKEAYNKFEFVLEEKK